MKKKTFTIWFHNENILQNFIAKESLKVLINQSFML